MQIFPVDSLEVPCAENTRQLPLLRETPWEGVDVSIKHHYWYIAKA